MLYSMSILLLIPLTVVTLASKFSDWPTICATEVVTVTLVEFGTVNRKTQTINTYTSYIAKNII